MSRLNIVYKALFLLIAVCLLNLNSVLACRLFIVVSPDSVNKNQQANLIDQLLIKDKISLLNQSKKGEKEEYLKLKTLEDVDGLYTDKGNPDGWGIVSYKNSSINKYIESTLPAYEDKLYTSTVKEISSQTPDIVMAHIRLAAPDMPVDKNNLHPFVYDGWAFMHNGYVDLINNPELIDTMKYYKELFGLSPKGNTDSETMFYYFLGKMIDKNKFFNTEQLPDDIIIESFAQSILEFNKLSNKLVRPFINQNSIYTGEVDFSPTMNLITTNGNIIMAYKQGKDLYFGKIKSINGGFYYVISSEVMTPVSDKDNQWYEIPDRYIFIINKETKELKMMPIEFYEEGTAVKNI